MGKVGCCQLAPPKLGGASGAVGPSSCPVIAESIETGIFAYNKRKKPAALLLHNVAVPCSATNPSL